jgi:hypothetical protein
MFDEKERYVVIRDLLYKHFEILDGDENLFIKEMNSMIEQAKKETVKEVLNKLLDEHDESLNSMIESAQIIAKEYRVDI